MGGVSGSIKSVRLDGTSFDVLGDSNFSEVGGNSENEAIPTSGTNIKKMTRRAEIREGVVLACNGFERDILKTLSERTSDFPMSYTTAAGDTFSADGWIEFENRETEEIRATVQLHPRLTWTQFIAN